MKRKLLLALTLTIISSACSVLTADERTWQNALTTARLYDLGMRKMRHGEYQKAIPYFQKTLAEDPNCISAREQLARAHYQLGNEFMEWQQFAKAAEQYRIALEINPKLADAGRGLAATERYRQISSLEQP
ncbi:MAG: tetratricopeptide repeat protein [Candidatus Schekmanbacteria bacterium]|nr:tetratricopeptide repeat protein [Candidatus Schekmanbacteria bacterium]